MGIANVQYAKTNVKKKRVYYTGTDTLYEGYALCYNFDSITDYKNVADANITVATYAAARRLCVEKPAEGNKIHFAGVVAESDAKSTGWITINEPGSVCNVYTYSSVDHGSTGLTTASGQLVCVAPGQYYMLDGGYPGTGAAMVLQDVDRSSTAGLAMAELQTGPPSGGINVVTLLKADGVESSALSAPFAQQGVYEFTDSTLFSCSLSVHILAAPGNWLGQKLKLKTCATLISSAICVIVSTAAKACVSTVTVVQASSYVDLSADAEYVELEWNGNAWKVLSGHEAGGIVT